MQRIRFTQIFMFSFLVLAACPGMAVSAEEEKGVLAGGVVHNIASDRKVEKIGGILQPEPLDLYLKRLFQELSAQMTRIEKRLEDLEKEVRVIASRS